MSHRCCCSAEAGLAEVDAAVELDAGSAVPPEVMVEAGRLGFLGLGLPCPITNHDALGKTTKSLAQSTESRETLYTDLWIDGVCYLPVKRSVTR